MSLHARAGPDHDRSLYIVEVEPVGGVVGWSAAKAVQVAAVESEPRIAAANSAQSPPGPFS